LDFNYQFTNSDTFDIFTIQGYFGTYVKLDGPLALENFPSSSSGSDLITICAQDIEGCCQTFEFAGPDCSPECTIFNIVAEPIECENTTSFVLALDFDHINLESSGVDIYTGETYLGFYNIDDLPFQIFGFPVPITEFAEITICRSDDSLCCYTIQFDPLNCAEEFCDIFNLNYEISECDSLNNFFITLDFDFLNPGEAGFNVIGNGVNYGNYTYENIPFSIGPLPAGPELDYEFLVQDLEDNTCFDFVEVGIVECEVNRLKFSDRIQAVKLMYQAGKPHIYIPSNDLKLSIYQTNGSLIMHKEEMPALEWFGLNHSKFIPGIYFIELTNEEDIHIGKMIIME
jgi:hypothetical protein